MKRIILSLATLALIGSSVFAKEGRIKFEEYDLPNGLHVILHDDPSTPIVNVSVMYHVGSKNEDPQRTGFAHFFEHLMFEGTKNIERGEYMKIVQQNGGVLNAFTSHDVTYYFQTLPSNQLELGLWLESERMLHPVIDSTGIETQRKVVQEEKKQSYDNRPYGQLMNVVFENLFTKHPYRWMPIGTEQYIDEAQYSEFMDFFKTFYVPNNAVLVVAGDLQGQDVKGLIAKYFSDIPKGTHEIPRPTEFEDPMTEEKRVTFHDDVQLPAVILAYQAPKAGTDDYYALDMITTLLSNGASSRFQKQIVDKDQKALGVGAFAFPLEDPGAVLMFGIANMGVDALELENVMKAELDNLLKNGITEAEFKKVQNQSEKAFITQNSRISGIAQNLAMNYTFYKDANLVNTELERYQKITRADLERVAKKYLVKENSLVVHYLPKAK